MKRDYFTPEATKAWKVMVRWLSNAVYVTWAMIAYAIIVHNLLHYSYWLYGVWPFIVIIVICLAIGISYYFNYLRLYRKQL